MNRRGSVGVVVNPKARYHQQRPRTTAELERIVGERGLVVEVGDIEAAEQAARSFLEREIGVLAISGGDGTLGITLTAFEEAYGSRPLPVVTMLRGGTMNTVSRGVGIKRGRPPELLARLVERLDRGAPLTTASRATMRAGERICCIFGAGAIHGFLAEYYRAPNPSGLTGIRTLAVGLASVAAGGRRGKRIVAGLDARLTVDGEPRAPRHYAVVAASTQPELGYGFAPFHLAGPDVSGFHALSFDATPLGTARLLPGFYRSKPMPEGVPGRLDQLSRRLEVESTSGPFGYVLDGDLAEHDPADGPLVVTEGPMIEVFTGR